MEEAIEGEIVGMLGGEIREGEEMGATNILSKIVENYKEEQEFIVIQGVFRNCTEI